MHDYMSCLQDCAGLSDPQRCVPATVCHACRTALGMYDHIQGAIDRGECLLEWDGGLDHTPPPAPLLKDKFASERRKAKVGWGQVACVDSC
jgi:hypothetical protein